MKMCLRLLLLTLVGFVALAASATALPLLMSPDPLVFEDQSVAFVSGEADGSGGTFVLDWTTPSSASRNFNLASPVGLVASGVFNVATFPGVSYVGGPPVTILSWSQCTNTTCTAQITTTFTGAVGPNESFDVTILSWATGDEHVLTLQAVPEPSTALLVGSGLLVGLALARRLKPRSGAAD